MDLGFVCRGIRRRQYKSLRDVRLDIGRVFANCIIYHSHPSTPESLASISVAMHLREYFNMLWQEYMLPSDPPPSPTTSNEHSRASFEVLTKSHSEREKKRDRLPGILPLCTKSSGAEHTELLKACGDLKENISGMKVRQTKLQELSRKVIELVD